MLITQNPVTMKANFSNYEESQPKDAIYRIYYVVKKQDFDVKSRSEIHQEQTNILRLSRSSDDEKSLTGSCDVLNDADSSFARRLRTRLFEIKSCNDTLLIDHVARIEEIPRSEMDRNSNFCWHSSPRSSTRIRFGSKPEVDRLLSQNYSCITGASSEFPIDGVKHCFSRLFKVCFCIGKIFMSPIVQGFREIFQLEDETKISIDELSQTISSLRYENQHVISALEEKVNSLSSELDKVRVKSETSLAALTEKMIGMQEAKEQLVEKNNVLEEQLKSLQNSLEKPKIVTSQPSVPPPPPPPLPPPLPPQSFLPVFALKRSKATPGDKENVKEARSRPAITVEDLKKVTLKKAGQSQEKEATTNKGLEISSDMLRSVKLRSIRRKSSEFPRRSSKITNNSPLNSAEKVLLQILNSPSVNVRNNGFRKKLNIE